MAGVRSSALRYKRHYFVAVGIHAQAVAAEFLEHANEEQGHADVAERITQLGGAPNFNPEGLLTRSHAEYKEGETPVDMIKEDSPSAPSSPIRRPGSAVGSPRLRSRPST
jgi:bacterioferritin (cytochrome b1)